MGSYVPLGFPLAIHGPIAFLWASSACLLIPHSHGLFTNFIGLPRLNNLILIFGVHELAINHYSLSLHCLGPAATLSHFSNSYSAYGMLFLSFLTSLSPLAFSRPMYTFVGPVTHYSCRLGLMVLFTIYPINSLWPSLLGLSVCWASTNGPQQVPNGRSILKWWVISNE